MKKPNFLLWLLSILMIAPALFIAGCTGNKGKYPVLPEENQAVSADLSAIPDGSGLFFTYPSSSGRNVDYFVYKDSSGNARAVLDACRTCYRWRKGYRLEEDQVICIKCGMKFALDGLAEGTGSCVPIALTSRREGDGLVISVSELEAGAKYF